MRTREPQAVVDPDGRGDASDLVARLQRLTHALLEAMTVEAVTEVVVTHGVEAFEADAGIVYLPSADGTSLEIAQTRGYPPGAVEPYRRVPLDLEIPGPQAFRTGQAYYFESFEQFQAEYPAYGARIRPTRTEAFAALPLATSEPIGVLVLAFTRQHRFDADHRAFAQSLADQGALAIERARTFETARRAVTAREDLLAIVSHDLRNPLGLVSLHAQAVKRRLASAAGSGDEVARAGADLEIILESVRRMERLIRDLSDFSRIEAGCLEVKPSRNPIVELLRQALAAIRPLAGSRKLELCLETEEPSPAAWCDGGRIFQVLSNLLENAVAFTRDDGTVTASLAEDAGRFIVSIADDGSGISREELPRVFERYCHGSAERLAGSGGLGLGLFICRGLVEAHGGRIWAESRPGEGSSFSFTLPRP
jgi:signal transduction histidine kinase